MTAADNRRIVIKKYDNSFIYFVLENDKLVNMYFEDNDAFHIGDCLVGHVEKFKKEAGGYFVNIAKGVQGYLPIDETKELRSGRNVAVQIKSEARGNKLYGLTGNIEFTGRYVVVYKKNKMSFSKKLSEGRKQELKTAMTGKVNDCGVLFRSECEVSDIDIILEEYNRLSERIRDIEDKEASRALYSKIYSGDSILNKLINDGVIDERVRVITDDEDVLRFISEKYEGIGISLSDNDIITLYGLKNKVKEALANKVYLKSGGYLYIQKTEALHVIDVNSGSMRTGDDDSALSVNMEAADEIFHQLSLRNLSGIIIIDFINMKSEASKTILTNRIKKLASEDKNRTKYVDITKLGLVELTRAKKLRDIYELKDIINNTILM